MNTQTSIVVAGFGMALIATLINVTFGSALASDPRATPEADHPNEKKTGSIEGVFLSEQRLKTRGATSERDVIVYLRAKDPKKHNPPKDPVIVRQKKLQFQPHVLPLLIGSTVSFVNEDKVDHNVFSSEDCCKVDANTAPGKTHEVTFSKAGTVPIVCRLHPEMALWVLVLEEPWFTTLELKKEKTKSGDREYVGSFSIADVPPGDYELTYWNKKLKPKTHNVTIKAGAVTKLDVTVEKD